MGEGLLPPQRHHSRREEVSADPPRGLPTPLQRRSAYNGHSCDGRIQAPRGFQHGPPREEKALQAERVQRIHQPPRGQQEDSCLCPELWRDRAQVSSDQSPHLSGHIQPGPGLQAAVQDEAEATPSRSHAFSLEDALHPDGQQAGRGVHP